MDAILEKKVSIALCTYNGERFLQEQLDSIAVQTVRPFELVICDDVSSDSTREILEKFAKDVGFPVKLYFNPANLGFVKNFEKAISLCSGDIIFLSDQDDKWRSDKIEVMQKYFSDPKIGMVFSNARIIDVDGNPTGEMLWDLVRFTPGLQQLFQHGDAYQVLYRQPIVSGCTMAFVRSLWPQIQPIPTGIPSIHDIWIALMAAILSEVIAINQPLIDRRLHSQQPSAPYHRDVTAQLIDKAKSGEKQQRYQEHLVQLHLVRKRILQAKNIIMPKKQAFLQQYMNEQELHLITRINVPSRFILRYYVVLKELGSGRYHRFSNGFKSAFADLLQHAK